MAKAAGEEDKFFEIFFKVWFERWPETPSNADSEDFKKVVKKVRNDTQALTMRPCACGRHWHSNVLLL